MSDGPDNFKNSGDEVARDDSSGKPPRETFYYYNLGRRERLLKYFNYTAVPVSGRARYSFTGSCYVLPFRPQPRDNIRPGPKLLDIKSGHEVEGNRLSSDAGARSYDFTYARLNIRALIRKGNLPFPSRSNGAGAKPRSRDASRRAQAFKKSASLKAKKGERAVKQNNCRMRIQTNGRWCA